MRTLCPTDVRILPSMRLRTRYVATCLGIFFLICTYELYSNSGTARDFMRSVSGDHFKFEDDDFLHGGKGIRRRVQVRREDTVQYTAKNHQPPLSLNSSNQRLVTVTADEFRRSVDLKTGNPLIDDYGSNDLHRTGEMGRGVTFVGAEKKNVAAAIEKYRLNVIASDLIPLNRMVPDSRLSSCASKKYEHDLPTTSVIVPFFDEWPSILIRTIYSIVNRTPRHILQEVILVDDGSEMEELKKPLADYIKNNFPSGLVKLIRLPVRVGLIKARIQGWKTSKGKVVVFFDSHMEVNIDWVQPLLTEIKQNRKTVAMGVLDYINSETFEYRFNEGYLTRYGFDWRLVFFETFFRQDQMGITEDAPRPGAVMVGAAYAIDSRYFGEIGTYDEGMKVWGGENLEMAWRVWMCGGRLIHLPCSHLGHIARTQPYSFPGGRHHIEVYNYRRAVEVWMEPRHKSFIYDHFPDMKNMDSGDLSERLKLKESLHCKNFTWYMDNIWPELAVFDKNVFAWGSARNLQDNRCLDNHQYLFQAPENLFLEPCHYKLAAQGFSWRQDKLLQTSLQCVVLKQMFDGVRPMLEDCIIGPRDTWLHEKNGFIKHEKSGLCLDMDQQGPVMRSCQAEIISQKWQFNNYNY